MEPAMRAMPMESLRRIPPLRNLLRESPLLLQPEHVQHAFDLLRHFDGASLSAETAGMEIRPGLPNGARERATSILLVEQ